jgi:2-phosphosulfolactate phosphatase
MNISVIRPKLLEQIELDSGDYFIVVDTFRATTTLTVIAEIGVKTIYVVKNQHDARFVQDQLCSDCLLVGEEKGLMIPGFDFGNSPTEILNEEIQKAKAIFTSSNGAKVLIQLKDMKNVYLGALVNLTILSETIGREAYQEEKNIFIVPAGNSFDPKEYVIEDWITSVLLVKKITSRKKFQITVQDDFWNRTIRLLDEGADIKDLIINSKNGKYLTKIGFEKDLYFSASIDKMSNFLKVKKWLKIDESDCIVLE